MPAFGEHEPVQARILKYAQKIGWTYVPREEAERRPGVDHDGTSSENCAMLAQLMTAQIRVHDLDLGEILQQPVAEFGEGLSPDFQRPIEKTTAAR
jgi:hypothetical protein